MRAIYHLLTDKIVSTDKDMVGVVLFGTMNKTSEDTPHDNVFEVIRLDLPSAEGVKKIKALMDSDFDPAEHESGGPIAPTTPCPLRTGIWSCSQTFQVDAHKDKTADKQLLIFTTDDDPLKGDKEAERRVKQIVQDSSEAGMGVGLCHIQNEYAAEFQVDKFFRGILVMEEDASFDDKVHAAADFAEMHNRIRIKTHRKRVLSRIPFYLSPPQDEQSSSSSSSSASASASLSAPATHQCTLSASLSEEGDGSSSDDIPTVSFQVQVLMTTAPTKVSVIKLDGRDNSKIVSQRKKLSESTGQFLDELDVKTYVEVGGQNERAYLSRAELKVLRKYTDHPGIQVLGFVSRTWLKPWYSVRSPYFLRPDEATMRGSTVAFVSLLEGMVAKAQIAIARFVRTKAESPKLVAVVPQQEDWDGNGKVVQPAGFNVIVLPFADDVRDLQPEATAATASDECVAAAVEMTKTEIPRGGMGGDFGLMDIENPTLQKQYAVLEALALDEMVKDPGDSLAPDLYQSDKTVAAMQTFLKTLPEFTAPEKKRKAPAAAKGEGGSAPKKVKAEVDPDSIDWKQLAADGQVKSKSMPVLKAFLKSRNLPVSGKKDDLVARVEEALQE